MFAEQIVMGALLCGTVGIGFPKIKRRLKDSYRKEAAKEKP